MSEAVVPHVITAEQAADALGITVVELARNLETAVETRLRKLGAQIVAYEIRSLDEFDEEVAGARRLFESTLACWAIIDEGSNA